MAVFDKISNKYADKSLVQYKASSKLRDLLAIKGYESVLDVGCGPGNITFDISKITKGRLAGVDVSAAMIQTAKEKYPRIEFSQSSAESMDYKGEFDVVYCNSAFQWFSKPLQALEAMHKALKPGGRIGLACPGTSNWSPFFMSAIAKVSQLPEIKPVFLSWKSPWIFLPEKEDYKKLFEASGFDTIFFNVDYEAQLFSVEEAFGVYLSGAANGFTIKSCYRTEISDEYVELFNKKVKEEFESGAQNGKVTLDFNRFYYTGRKKR